MENEILKILQNIQSTIAEMQEGQKATNERLTKLEEGQQRLEEGQQRIEKKLDITYDQVARTAEDITSIKDDMSTVETVTAKNWADIVKLKSVK